MDKTQSFKAAVMTVKVQRKGELDKNRILPKNSSTSKMQRDEFSKQAKDVLNKITNLRNILIENRNAYMRIGYHLKNAAQMTDEQRDLIDRETEKFVIHYTQHLAQMRADWKRAKRKPQQHEHIEAVIDLLMAYLRSVDQIHTEQKKYRIHYELELHRLLKLAWDKKMIPVRLGGIVKQEMNHRNDGDEVNGSGGGGGGGGGGGDHDDDDDVESDVTSEMDLDDSWLNDDERNDFDEIDKRKKSKYLSEIINDNTSKMNGTNKSLISAQSFALDEDMEKSQQQLVDDEAKELSPEDVQMFEEENVQLYHELQGLTEEVEQIEKNVVDIAQLQDIFTEKVSMQQHNIDRIANAVIGATENVKDANEQIKQAIQRNAGLRVWSLFFLLVMSFALLFLDWYYD